MRLAHFRRSTLQYPTLEVRRELNRTSDRPYGTRVGDSGASLFCVSMALTSDAKSAIGGGGGDRSRFEFSIPTIKPTVLTQEQQEPEEGREFSRPATKFRPLCTHYLSTSLDCIFCFLPLKSFH